MKKMSEKKDGGTSVRIPSSPVPLRASGSEMSDCAIGPAVVRRNQRLWAEPLFRVLGMRPPGRSLALSRVRSALVVRLDGIGDAVLTSPLLRELRRNLPRAWITAVVSPLTFNLFERCPYVNEVLIYDTLKLPRRQLLRRHLGALSLAFRRLWRRRFDLALVPRWDTDTYHATWVAYFSGAPWRVGYTEKTTGRKATTNAGYDRLLSHVLTDLEPRHEVERNLQVLRHLGGTVRDDKLEIWTDSEDAAFARQVVEAHGAQSGYPLIALAPGAAEPDKIWPPGNFVRLGRWLRDVRNARIVVVGGAGDEELGLEIEKELGRCAVSLAGQATLRQTAAVLRRCRLYVGNDSAPMHMAAAAGTPVVEVCCHPSGGDPSHQRSPKRFGPWAVPHTVVQPSNAKAPCVGACSAGEPHCILSVTVEQVRAAVAKQLSQ